MLTLAHLMSLWTHLTGMAPLILPGLVKKFNHNWIVSSEKASGELEYRPMNARSRILNTVKWFQERT